MDSSRLMINIVVWYVDLGAMVRHSDIYFGLWLFFS